MKFSVVIMTISVLLMVISPATAQIGCSRICGHQRRLCYRLCGTSDQSCINNCYAGYGKCYKRCRSRLRLRRDEDLILPDRFPENKNGFY